MKRFLLKFGIFVGLLGSTNLLASVQYKIITDSSNLRFIAVGKPGFLKIRGSEGELGGVITMENNEFTGNLKANLVTIKTGIDLRDKHMHEKYLQSDKFPHATLRLKQVVFDNQNTGSCTFLGELTIKDKTQKVEGICEILGVGSGIVSGNAEVIIDIEDFPIGTPSYLGIKVADKVTITVQFKARKLN